MTIELLVGTVIGLAGLITAGVGWYRARPDKEATVVTTATDMAERLVTTATAMVAPLEARIVAQSAYQTAESKVHAERLVSLELRIAGSEKSHQDCLDREVALGRELETLKARIGNRRVDDTMEGEET